MKSVISIIKEEIALMETREQFHTIYHGTSNTGAADIEQNGVDITKSHGGYFGWGFYCAVDYELAKSNYAEFADENDIDERGAVLEFEILPQANILDLRDEDDWQTWLPYAKRISDRNLYKTLVNAGIDGLFDNSFGGVIIYNPAVLKLIRIGEL